MLRTELFSASQRKAETKLPTATSQAGLGADVDTEEISVYHCIEETCHGCGNGA